MRRPRDAALAEQGVERNEQVEVQAADVHCSHECCASQNSVGIWWHARLASHHD
jgi:hypothetical protein